MIVPKPTFTVEGKALQWRPTAYLEGQPDFKPNPDFVVYLESNGFKTMREFMDNPKRYRPVGDAEFKCGFTKLDGIPQPIPKNDQIRTTGYAHVGPCEIWLDDVKVFYGKNCHDDISPSAAYQKLDFSSCVGKCTMYWYWMGIRGSGKSVSWQIYKECIPLIDRGGTASTPKAVSAPAKKAPAHAAKSDKVGAEATGNVTILDSKCKVKNA